MPPGIILEVSGEVASSSRKNFRENFRSSQKKRCVLRSSSNLLCNSFRNLSSRFSKNLHRSSVENVSRIFPRMPLSFPQGFLQPLENVIKNSFRNFPKNSFKNIPKGISTKIFPEIAPSKFSSVVPLEIVPGICLGFLLVELKRILSDFPRNYYRKSSEIPPRNFPGISLGIFPE